MRTLALRLYVGVIAVSALVAVALLPGSLASVDIFATAVLLLLSALAGARPVRFIGKGNEVTATHSVIIAALAALGALPALLTAIVGLLSTFAFRRRPRQPLRCVFNFAGIVLSTSLAAHLFFALGGQAGNLRSLLPWPLVVATVAYFACNNGLVVIAVALERGRPVRTVWSTLSWTAASHFAGIAVSLGLVASYQFLGPMGLAVGIPPIWVLLSYYAAHHEKIREKEQRIAQVETLNEALVAKVDELQLALDEVRELRQLLPICMHCKSIRDDDNSWQRIETYISAHYDTSFTHSLCDDCRETHYDVPHRHVPVKSDK